MPIFFSFLFFFLFFWVRLCLSCTTSPRPGTPMLQLAKVLHSKGFYITYLNSEYNHKRLLRSRGPDSLSGLQDFQFEAVPDGLPQSDNDDVTQDIAELCISKITKNSLVPFRDLHIRLNNSPEVPPVSCVIADGVMSFARREGGREDGNPSTHVLDDECLWVHGLPPLL